MTTGYVINAGDGYGWHTEVLRGVAACGKVFDVESDDVDRDPYDPPSDPDEPHATVSFDCFGTPRRTPNQQKP